MVRVKGLCHYCFASLLCLVKGLGPGGGVLQSRRALRKASKHRCILLRAQLASICSEGTGACS